jgi:hypothetical protein
MNESNRKTGAGAVIEAEKGDNLSPKNLHLRLRVVEVVLVISLFLNLLHWFVAGANDHKIQNQVDNISAETGAPK